MPNSDPHSEPSPSYVVVARRYRPQTFGELIGQEHVSQALSNAIATNRVGHAYLFTGARGTGKTSTARIFAKALNCVNGPTAEPCNQCDICQSISTGDDVDVLEIDGASNRGIDEIRQLRQNVNVRPSRARFKIYIIDEVHMLTARGLQRLAEDARGAAGARQIHLLHDRGDEDPDHDPVAVPAVRFRRHLHAIDLRPVAANCRGRRGPGRGRSPGGPGPPGRRFDARQPVAPGATAVLRLGADHRGRRAWHARHRGRSAADGHGEESGRAERGGRTERS